MACGALTVSREVLKEIGRDHFIAVANEILALDTPSAAWLAEWPRCVGEPGMTIGHLLLPARTRCTTHLELCRLEDAARRELGDLSRAETLLRSGTPEREPPATLPSQLATHREVHAALRHAALPLPELLPRVIASSAAFELYLDQFLQWPDFPKAVAMAMREPHLASAAYHVAERFMLASADIIAALRYGLTHHIAQPHAWAWVYTPLALARALGRAAASVVPQIEKPRSRESSPSSSNGCPSTSECARRSARAMGSRCAEEAPTRHGRMTSKRPHDELAMPTHLRVTLSCLAFAVCALAGACGHVPKGAHLETHTLASPGGPSCRGYFTWSGPVQHVVLVLNGTGTRSNAFLPAPFEGMVRDRAVLYATLDRPGITASFGAPDAATKDDAALEAATQIQLLACVSEAMHWIAERFGPTLHIHVRGHSEGALLSLRLYQQLSAQEPLLAAQIETLILTGTPLEAFRTVIASQLDVIDQHDGGELRAAVSRCEWPTLRDRLGVSCAYLEDAYTQPSGRELFESLARNQVRAQFYLFHGTKDWNASVDRVRDLESWAQTQPLALHIEYYEGGHNDPPESTRQEVSSLVVSLTDPSAASMQR
jgi:hypothetical protein